MSKSLWLALLTLLLIAGTLSPVHSAPEQPPPDSPGAPDSLLSPEFDISRPSTGVGEDWHLPAAAYNSLRGGYLVATHYSNALGSTVYAKYWTRRTGDWIWFYIHEGVQPAVAYNRTNDQYLVVFMWDSNDADSNYEIWGSILPGDGASGGLAVFLIFQWPNRSFWTPRVAWNSLHNEYLVVWNAVNTVTGQPNDVAAARVSASGTVLPGAPILVTDSGWPHQANVAYNVAADEYLVVWRRMASSANGDIYGARLRGADGTLVTPPGEIPISWPIEDQQSPTVTTNQQHRWLVLWQYAYPGPCCDWDIRGRELDVAGGLVGSEIIVAQTTDDEQYPQAVARPGPFRDYLAVWQRSTSTQDEIWASRWGDPGVRFDFFQVAAAAFWDNDRPTVAAIGGGYLFAYESDSQGDPTVRRHIYGRYWAPYATFVPAVQRKAP